MKPMDISKKTKASFQGFGAKTAGLFKGTHRVTVTKRASGTTGHVILSRLLAILASAVLVGLVLLLALPDKSNFGAALSRVFIDRFGNNIGMAIKDAVPLLIVTLGVAVAFKMKLWNIGGNGQMIAGCMFAFGAWFYCQELSPALLIPMMMIASVVGGALCASVAAFAKAYLNVNETIVTLMMNYIMVLIGEYMICLEGPWNSHMGFEKSIAIGSGVVLSEFGKSGITTSIFIAIAMLVLFYFVMQKSKWGYEIRVTGESNNVAKYAGMPVKRNIIITLLVSGGIAGLAGYCILTGMGYNNGFSASVVGDMGFTAVMVAWLARLNPWGIAFMSLFIAGVKNGANSLQSYKVDKFIADFIQGLILMMILAWDYMTRYRIAVTAKKPIRAEEDENKCLNS